MVKRHNANRGRFAPSVTPQGKAGDAESAEDPKTKLENRAKKSNTRI
ncbi:small, acid-soluble spore protein L [Heyndrickxia acidiproducens]|nr:small, acid-soluble spore protein L [Heyndrickxia acidiproducens]